MPDTADNATPATTKGDVLPKQTEFQQPPASIQKGAADGQSKISLPAKNAWDDPALIISTLLSIVIVYAVTNFMSWMWGQAPEPPDWTQLKVGDKTLIDSAMGQLKWWTFMAKMLYPVGNLLLAMGIICPVLAAQKPSDQRPYLKMLTVLAGISGTVAMSCYSTFHIPELLNRTEAARVKLEFALEDYAFALRRGQKNDAKLGEKLKTEKQEAELIFLGDKDTGKNDGPSAAKGSQQSSEDGTPR